MVYWRRSGERAQDKALAEGRGPNPAAICTTGCVGVREAAKQGGDEFAIK